GSEDRIARLKKTIRHLFETAKTIGIYGESGTGKLTLAKEIHFEQFGQNAPIIILDCRKLQPGTYRYEEIERAFTAVTRGTIIVNHVELLTGEYQDRMFQWIGQLSDQVKMILLETTRKDNHGSDCLSSFTDETVYLEPLEKRKGDIPFLANYFLTDMRIENGSEKIGIKQDAVACLQEYAWPGNVAQLKKVMNNLCSVTAK